MAKVSSEEERAAKEAHIAKLKRMKKAVKAVGTKQVVCKISLAAWADLRLVTSYEEKNQAVVAGEAVTHYCKERAKLIRKGLDELKEEESEVDGEDIEEDAEEAETVTPETEEDDDDDDGEEGSDDEESDDDDDDDDA